MPSQQEWVRAFAKQAKADFDAWTTLQDVSNAAPEGASQLPRCQKLHFLQMAFEKLAKAHLLEGGSRLADLKQSHAYIARNIPLIVWGQMNLEGASKRAANAARQSSKRIAREIELLSPSVNDGGKREDNCEYPWEEGGFVRVPAEWTFPNLNILTEPAARNILKRVRTAIERLAS
jgi:hypothetical protein